MLMHADQQWPQRTDAPGMRSFAVALHLLAWLGLLGALVNADNSEPETAASEEGASNNYSRPFSFEVAPLLYEKLPPEEEELVQSLMEHGGNESLARGELRNSLRTMGDTMLINPRDTHLCLAALAHISCLWTGISGAD